MVLSTVNQEGQPESAVVGFGETDDLELIFGTSQLSRKAKNISQNDRVAVVIGWTNEGTLQYEGTARLLTGSEAEKYAEIYYQKSPGSRRYRDDPNERYFLITPGWLRFSQLQDGKLLATVLVI